MSPSPSSLRRTVGAVFSYRTVDATSPSNNSVSTQQVRDPSLLKAIAPGVVTIVRGSPSPLVTGHADAGCLDLRSRDRA